MSSQQDAALSAAVDAFAAKVRAAALNEAADAISRQRILLDTVSEDRDITRSATYARAAAIVRNLAANPPP